MFPVKDALSGIKDSLLPILEEMCIPANIITKIDHQWNSLSLVNWQEKSNTASFWTKVKNYIDASGENPFKELSDFELSMLVLPHSNAEIERVFSQMNIIKNKLRNRMGTEMVKTQLTICFSLKRKSKACHDYELTESVFKQCETSIDKSINNGEACMDMDEELLNYGTDINHLLI